MLQRRARAGCAMHHLRLPRRSPGSLFGMLPQLPPLWHKWRLAWWCHICHHFASILMTYMAYCRRWCHIRHHFALVLMTYMAYTRCNSKSSVGTIRIINQPSAIYIVSNSLGSVRHEVRQRRWKLAIYERFAQLILMCFRVYKSHRHHHWCQKLKRGFRLWHHIWCQCRVKPS